MTLGCQWFLFDNLVNFGTVHQFEPLINPTPNAIQTKIGNDERLKRQRYYEIAKEDSLKRGVELTPETVQLLLVNCLGRLFTAIHLHMLFLDGGLIT